MFLKNLKIKHNEGKIDIHVNDSFISSEDSSDAEFIKDSIPLMMDALSSNVMIQFADEYAEVINLSPNGREFYRSIKQLEDSLKTSFIDKIGDNY